MNKNETFGIVAREYLARNGYGLQLHDIDKEVDSVILAAQQSDKEEKLNSTPSAEQQTHVPICGNDVRCNFQIDINAKGCTFKDPCSHKQEHA